MAPLVSLKFFICADDHGNELGPCAGEATGKVVGEIGLESSFYHHDVVGRGVEASFLACLEDTIDEFAGSGFLDDVSMGEGPSGAFCFFGVIEALEEVNFEKFPGCSPCQWWDGCHFAESSSSKKIGSFIKEL